MNKEKAREKLNDQKEELKKNLEKFKELEKNLNDAQDDADILGPRDELEYQRMRKDIEESDKDEQ